MFRIKSFFVLLTLLSPTLVLAEDLMRCRIHERYNGQKKTYFIEAHRRENYTVHYYQYAHLIPNFFIRAHGMTGGGATFLHLDVEDKATGLSSLTKVGKYGTLYFGTRHVSVQLECEIR